MSLIYIKGTPGSGKTTIRERLSSLGYESHDADDRDMGGPYNNATNKRVEYPKNPSKEWFEAHSYRLIPKAVERLHENAKNKLIFLCGTASNEDDLWDLFDQIIFLNIDEETLKKRIARRTNSDYGKTSHELELIMDKYRDDEQKRTRSGVVSVDATKPIGEVVSSILSATSR